MWGFPSVTALLLGVSVAIHTAGAVSCGNVTIANASDADAVRRDCRTITGDLTFAYGLNETINLDGVETILGDISHSGCEDDVDDECVIPPPFSISSSTLQTINGSLYFWYFNGLTELRFPNLTRVQDTWSIKRMHELTLLDVTKLAYLGYMVIEAQNLTTLRHEQLKGFTLDYAGGVAFWAGAMDSVDSFYSAPIVVPGNIQSSSFSISAYNLPNVRHVTLGWANVQNVQITGNGLMGVTLGAENTTTMNLGSLQMRGNIASFDRGAAVQNLTVDQFYYSDSNTTTALDLPFDQVSSISISSHDRLQNLTVPAQAQNWKDLSLFVGYCHNLTLDATARTLEDGTQEQTWYWPQGNIESINLYYVGLSNAFFDSFLAGVNASTNATRVIDNFRLYPTDAHVFDCTPFDTLRKNGLLNPPTYSCQNVTADEVDDANTAGVAALRKSLVFGVAIAAMAISWM